MSENQNPPLSQDDVEIMGDEVEDRDYDSDEFDTEATEQEQEQEGTEIEGVNELNDQGKPRSIVWQHMKEVTVNGVKKNKCIHCSALLSVQKGKTTSHLMRHLKSACPARNKIFPKPLILKEKDSSTVQSQLLGMINSEGASSISTFTFNFDRVKELAAHMILAHEYPFSIVEHKVFNVFLKAYTPYYKPITRYTVRKECFKVYEIEKEKLKKSLAKVSKVSLTTDCWTSGVQKIGYMTITVHYIDRNWNLQKRVLSFVNVPPPHTGVALAKEVHRVCNLFGITDKVCSVTLDNASANDVCISTLRNDYNSLSKLVLDGKLFHVRCCAHIINLLVKDGLKEIEKVTESVRDGVKYLFGSEIRLRSFNEHRMNLKLKPNKLVLDNNTRWNSTYVMLSTAYKYKQCFSKFGEDDDSFAKYVPSENQWEEVNEVCEFLENFLDVTNLISGSNYPTVNLFLLELSRIKELINAQLDISCNKHMQSMALKMADKYDKYWKECDLLLCFGSILDPRYKKAMIKFAYQSMYPSNHKDKIKIVMAKFDELFMHYVKIYGDEKEIGLKSHSANSKTPPSSTIGKRKFDEFVMTLESKGNEKSDLELYFEEGCFPNVNNFDALAWWKGNEGKYKVLSKMAMDILSIPITTVASESTFSAGGRVVDKKRASMRRDTIEVLLCGGDWIKEAYGIRSLKEGNEDPIELEHENEYEMKDSIDSEIIDFTVDAAGGGSKNVECIPSQVAQSSKDVTWKQNKLSYSTVGQPSGSGSDRGKQTQTNSKIQKKKTRRT